MSLYPTFVHFNRYYKSILIQQERLKSQYDDSSDEITMASYNVLAQYLIDTNMYLYTECQDEYLKWEYRQKNLLAEIKELNCDIFCFQEIQADHYINFYYPEMTKLGYEGVFKKRTRSKRDGCATFYKSDVLALESARGVEFYRPRQGCSLLDRDNVALILNLRLKHKSLNTVSNTNNVGGRRICVANVHLLFNPKREDVRLAQSIALTAEIEAARINHEVIGKPKVDDKDENSDIKLLSPVIVCGDFNSAPFSRVYRHLISKTSDLDKKLKNNYMGPCFESEIYSVLETNSLAKALNLRDLTHSLDLSSVYNYNSKDSDLKEQAVVTTKNSNTGLNVDYVFYTGGEGDDLSLDDKKDGKFKLESRLKLLASYNLLTEMEVMTKMGGYLPSRYISSDHMCLAAKFLIHD
ncbi:unnamed protein product [Gordionus sp. m RMFG-2023]